MSFKIVETIEKGQYKLTTVPQFWENGGTLRWPKLNREKSRRDPFSTPDDNWRSMYCVVKRNNIKTFEEAENELKAMSDVSDTDQEIGEILLRKSKPIQPVKTNFNNMARKCVETIVSQAQVHNPSGSKVRAEPKKSLQVAEDSNETSLIQMESEISEFLVFPPAPTKSKPDPVRLTQFQAYEYRENVPENEFYNSDIILTKHTQEETSKEFAEEQLSVTNTDILMTTVKDLSNKLASVETKVDEFIATNSKNQVIITINQQTILQTLSQISTQFDEFIKHTSTSKTQKNNLNEGIKTISDEESLIKFEQSLQKNQFLEEMKKVYSVVCGKGKGRAINNAYALIDAMFDRNFLTQCSWAGGSRGEGTKICFKSCKRTISLFFDIIYESDKQFTKLECESFLKNILRNAKKRCESKQLKRSTQKRIQKKKELENKGTGNVTGNEEREEIEPVNEESEDEIVNDPENKETGNVNGNEEREEIEPVNEESEDEIVNDPENKETGNVTSNEEREEIEPVNEESEDEIVNDPNNKETGNVSGIEEHEKMEPVNEELEEEIVNEPINVLFKETEV